MQLCRDYPLPIENHKTVVCLGCFDALHKGHQTLIDKAVAVAKDLGARSVCFTFQPYPHHYFAKLADKERLPTLQRFRDRYAVLESMGVNVMFACRFNAKIAAMSPDAFVDQVLLKGLSAAAVVVGEDFRFGRGRSAGAAELMQLAEARGITCHVMQPIMTDCERISSTLVRETLLAGDLAQVAELLGRDYTHTGVVRAGDGRGRQIGFPTANVFLPPGCLPVQGVFVVTLVLPTGERLPAVANCGPQPTFGGMQTRLEVHCLNYAADLYGLRCQVLFHQQLRGVKAFSGVEELCQQIAVDVGAAKQYFGL